VGCRTRRDQAELIRVVRQPDGSVRLDRDRHLEGRGAYLCADGACWRLAWKRAAVQRALRTELPMTLRETLEHGDLAVARTATDLDAPATIPGGTDGT